jgi:hypothetical protein
MKVKISLFLILMFSLVIITSTYAERAKVSGSASVAITQEIYVSGSYDTLLNSALTIYYDFEEGSGAFVIASITHSLEFSEGIAFNFNASASYNIENLVMGTDADGNEFSDFYNGEISASISIPVTDEISVEPVIGYSFPLSDDAEDAIEAFSDDSDSVYGGINITLSF